MDIGRIFSQALRYALNGKRILPFFVLYSIIAALVLLAFHSIALNGISTILNILWLIPVFIVVLLIKLIFDIVITENASHDWKGKKTRFNFSIAKNRFWSVIGALLIVSVIIILVSLVPFIGTILSIVVSWFFLFVVPIIVLSKKKAVESVKTSYNLFMKNKLDVFLFWLLLSVISLVLTFIAFIPFISLLPSFGASIINGVSIAEAIGQNLNRISIVAIISILIISYVSVFDLAAKTFFYMQKKK